MPLINRNLNIPFLSNIPASSNSFVPRVLSTCSYKYYIIIRERSNTFGLTYLVLLPATRLLEVKRRPVRPLHDTLHDVSYHFIQPRTIATYHITEFKMTSFKGDLKVHISHLRLLWPCADPGGGDRGPNPHPRS